MKSIREHVILRGINRQDIFDDTEDYWTFRRNRQTLWGRGDGC